MQKSGRWLFSFSRRKKDSGINDGHQQGSDFSQASTYKGRSETGSANPATQSPLRSLTQEFPYTLMKCFIPHTKKTRKETDQKYHSIQTDDASSTSGSKVSTTSSNDRPKFKYSVSTKRDGILFLEETEFSIADILKATSNFSDKNVIGQGGFGTVYKGMLKNGSLVALKRAKKNLHSRQASSEFRSEIRTLSKVEHLNLVRLLGYLEHGDEQIVVVEYVGNGTLREHLDGTCGDVLELAERLDIAIDVAHAITYLHTYTDQPIIHRDIKASNILLTENLRAKVADFGFARLVPEDPDATHISTQIKGTAGYLDPEYIRTYQLTEKSDVYSFGVLLVELVTGRHPIERGGDANRDKITTRWAMEKFQQDEVVVAMDPRLRRSPAAIAAVEKVMALAYGCLASLRTLRPSMKRCAEVLWGIRREFREAQIAARAPRPAAAELQVNT